MKKSVVSVATTVGYNLCHMPWHRIKEAFDVSLENSRICSTPILSIEIGNNRGWCIPIQSLYKDEIHVFDWKYIRRTSSPW